MGTFKIKCYMFLIIIALLFVSCSEEKKDLKNMVSLEQYENSIEEYKILNQKQNAIITQNIENEALINEVVKELRSLTTATLDLRKNLESDGFSSVSKSDEIKKSLEKLKNKLNEANKKSPDNKHYIATIQNLRSIIEQKETEITMLRDEITKKDVEIQKQSTIISSQKTTITSQQYKLQQNQINAWYNMGLALLEVSEVIPEVKGKKDKDKISNAKLDVLLRSKECFETAQNMGHVTAKYKVNDVDKEITRIKNVK